MALNLFLLGWISVLGQANVGLNKYNIGEVEIDFLTSYYQQDGDNGAVLGGIGSQALNDAVFAVSVNVPVDSSYIFNAKISFDTYTSASSSMIDPDGAIRDALRGDKMPLSGASYSDERTYGNLGFTRILSETKNYNLGIGFSSEFDVTSMSFNGGFGIESADRNTSLQLNAVGMYDKWKLIYPIEFRYLESTPDTLLSKDVRNTLSVSAVISRVLTKRLQAAFIYEYTLQSGLLSTPFHRVVFNDGLPVDDFNKLVYIEQLPNTREKHAFGLRTSAYPFNALIVRNFFRYYFDSYGIKAYTAEIETPIKLNRFFSVYPFYRYYTQNAARYFKPFNTHLISDEFYTSDYDLSAFTSHKYGIGIHVSPPFGLYAIKNTPLTKRRTTLKGFNIRGGLYQRSNGLQSFFVSADLSITL